MDHYLSHFCKFSYSYTSNRQTQTCQQISSTCPLSVSFFLSLYIYLYAPKCFFFYADHTRSPLHIFCIRECLTERQYMSLWVDKKKYAVKAASEIIIVAARQRDSATFWRLAAVKTNFTPLFSWVTQGTLYARETPSLLIQTGGWSPSPIDLCQFGGTYINYFIQRGWEKHHKVSLFSQQ